MSEGKDQQASEDKNQGIHVVLLSRFTKASSLWHSGDFW
jgi:hypothetical protein